MDRILRAVRSPGYKPEISEAAPTQLAPGTLQSLVVDSTAVDATAELSPKPDTAAGTTRNMITRLRANTVILNRWLDAVVHFSGSQFVFFLILAAVLTWALLGIPFGASITWAVIISNVQAIVCYIFDSLLMRQQIIEYERDIRITAILQSRITSHKRMVNEILVSQYVKPTRAEVAELKRTAQSIAGIPAGNWLDRLSNAVAAFTGHMGTIAMFWVCIFIWLGFGPSLDWSDEWQLYINSSTSALMLMTFSFLANIRERHGAHIHNCLDALFKVDEELEVRLRLVTGDTTANPVVTIPAPDVSRGQRAIFYYADFVGTLAGVIIMIVVLAAWVAIGPSLQFNDSWWLLIGTYAGLMGMHDGFVLDNMQTCLHSYVDHAIEHVHRADMSVLDDLWMAEDVAREEPEPSKLSWTGRVSQCVVRFASKPVVVLLNVLLILGLLIGASLLKWTITGQLICNVPPSIIESFMMLIVLAGHNFSDNKRRDDLQVLYERRLELLCWAKELRAVENK